MTDWASVEVLLTAAVLALAWPREDELLLPERRDWRGTLRRLVSPAARRMREAQGGREADDYVRALHAEPETMVIRQSELPSAVRRFETGLVTPQTGEQARHRPPWKTAEHYGWTEAHAPAPAPRRRAPGDPPTIVMEVMRPAVAADLGAYLKALPGYDDAPGQSFPVVAPGLLALDAEDHDGAPHDVDDDQGEEEDLKRLEPEVADPEGHV